MMSQVPERKILLHPDLAALQKTDAEAFKKAIQKMLAACYPDLEPIKSDGKFLHCRRKGSDHL